MKSDYMMCVDDVAEEIEVQKDKLQRKTQEVKEREDNRQSHHYRTDRGGR